MIQNKYTNKAIADYKAGKITKEKAVKNLSNIRRGGGGSSSRAVAAARARGEALAKAAAEAKAAQEKAKKEKAVSEAKVIQEKATLKKRLVTKLIFDNRKMGVLTTRFSAERVINARLNSQNKQNYYSTGEVQPLTKNQGIAGKIQELNSLQRKASTFSIRSKQGQLKNELSLLGLTLGTTIIAGVGGIIALPKTLLNLAKNPSQLKKVPAAIKTSGANFGQLVRVSPTEALGVISGELLFLKGTGKTFNVVGKVGGRTANKLNPFLKKANKGKIVVQTKAGKTILRAGGTVKQIQEPLSKQSRLAGKRVTAVSAQANPIPAQNFLQILKKQRTVRKPIPNEATFSPAIKRLLKKFDDRTINKKELTLLQNKVPLLERSFFADPRGRFRPSRLGIGNQKDASLLDILSGDATFRTPKPQILVFENVRVARYPKSLSDVEKALKTGKTLSKSQAKRLELWQNKKTGQFKPGGFLTKEPEITLAPGEIIKKIARRGTALINGKRVPIIEVKVVKTTLRTKALLTKVKNKKITPAELRTLKKNLKKETGFKASLSRTTKIKPRARLPKRVPRKAAKRVTQTPMQRRRTMLKNLEKARKARATKTPKRAGRNVKNNPNRITTSRATKRKNLTRRATTARTARRKATSKTGKGIVSLSMPKRFTKKTLTKKQPTYYVITRKKGKIVKLYPKPLVLKDARDYLAYSIDNNLTKTAWFVPLGKRKITIKPPKNIQNYYSKVSRKLRPYKIRYGKKKLLLNGYIEKRKYFIDTSGEKKQAVKLRKIGGSKVSKRRIKPLRKRPTASVKPKKRKISPKMRKVLIARLKKARAAKLKI